MEGWRETDAIGMIVFFGWPAGQASLSARLTELRPVSLHLYIPPSLHLPVTFGPRAFPQMQ